MAFSTSYCRKSSISCNGNTSVSLNLQGLTELVWYRRTEPIFGTVSRPTSFLSRTTLKITFAHDSQCIWIVLNRPICKRDGISGRLGQVIDSSMQGSPALLAPAYAKHPAEAFIVQNNQLQLSLCRKESLRTQNMLRNIFRTPKDWAALCMIRSKFLPQGETYRLREDGRTSCETTVICHI